MIIGFGEALVDVLPTREVVGGAPLNFAVRAAQLSQPLGWKAALITRIGSDARGEKILSRLHETALDISAVQVDPQQPTGYVDVTLDHGQPSYVIGEKVAWDAISFEPSVAELSSQAAAICFGTLAQRSPTSENTLARILDAATDAIKIMDINVRKPYPSAALIERSLHRSDILKCNEEELRLLAEWLQLEERREPVAIAAELQRRFELSSVFWTRGAEGCQLQRGSEVVSGSVPQIPKEANADSVGAGDAASAALAIGAVAGWPDQKTVELANWCGAFAASRSGGTTPLPDEILQQVE